MPLNPCWTQEDGNFLDKDFVINPCSWYTKDKYFASFIEILLGLTYLDSVCVISCLKQWQLLSPVLLCIQVCVWKLILSKGVLKILFVNRVVLYSLTLIQKSLRLALEVWAISGVGKAHLAVLLKRKESHLWMSFRSFPSGPQSKRNLVLWKFSICILIWQSGV